MVNFRLVLTGFFGRLKNEFFRYRDWEGVTAEEFMGRLEAYLVYYRDGRIQKSLEWLSPMEYRRKLGYAWARSKLPAVLHGLATPIWTIPGGTAPLP